NVEPTVVVRKDLLMAVAVGAADVDVRAGIVGDERRILAAPHAGEILGRLEARRVAGPDGERRRGDHRDNLHPHVTPLSTHGALNSVTSSHDENCKLTLPSTRFVASTCVTVTLPLVAETCKSPPTR